MDRPLPPVFRDVTEEEFDEMREISCMQEKTFRKNEYIYHTGDVTQKLGIVLEGIVLIQNHDLWGNTSILGQATAGEVFAETYALCGKPMMVSVQATQDSRVLFLNMEIAAAERYAQRTWYNKIFRNLLTISSEKNLNLSRRIFCTSHKTIRGRLLTYLSQQTVRAGSSTFRVPFNRQQMADYLNVDRSALSKELGRMKEEGLIDYHKNEFTVLQFPAH